MFFQNPELKKIVQELSATRAVLERIAVVLEREPERQIDAVMWFHGTPKKEV